MYLTSTFYITKGLFTVGNSRQINVIATNIYRIDNMMLSNHYGYKSFQIIRFIKFRLLEYDMNQSGGHFDLYSKRYTYMVVGQSIWKICFSVNLVH